ncbi:MAG: DUF3857 domain-containing protein [Bacteroidetes bacterium]|nr:DUF3857 domain-containing protein [Bacteroidota bacterium]MCW5895810.1 DUF3857 domain-containing protein [Bacteroidota bacterium]
MTRLQTLILTLAVFFCGVVAFASSSNDLVEKGWKSLEPAPAPGGGQSEAEKYFKEAIDADKSNTRAHLGLSLLYEMQERKLEAWNAFRNVLTTEQNYYPYLSAQWLYTWDDKLRNSPASGMIGLLNQLTEKANPDGMMKAQAAEQLGTHFMNRGDLPQARGWFNTMNAITQWMVIGPFDNISASGFDKAFPPEYEFDQSKTYEGKNGIPATWFEPKAIRFDRWVDFTRYFAFSQAVYYANAFIFSPKKQSAWIRIGTSGSLKAFLNDEEIIRYFDENNNDLDTYIIETELQEGWNRLLVKCGYSEITRCNFMVRVTGSSGDPIDGLNISLSAQPYTVKPGAQSRHVENFAEAFFKEEIKNHPGRLENYVLLAQVYLMNDKAVEAELQLRQALKRSPNNILLVNKILEAYIRGQKFDEMTQTLEKLLTIEPHAPNAITYRIQQAIDNEDYETAERSLQQLKSLLPDSEQAYRQEIALYRKKKQNEKVLELNKEAYTKHPDVWEFAYLEATLAQTRQRNTDRAKQIVAHYLKNNYNANALSTLAEYSLTSSLSEWEAYYAKMIELEPAAPGYHYKMAKVYSSLELYDKAVQAMRRAIDMCPNSDSYWSELGELHRIMNDIPQAMGAYQSALKFNPANYDAREKLRELQGKKSIFSHFQSAGIDSAVKASPKSADYPNDNGAILLDDTKRVVFDKGTSMSQHELLVKLFNKTGIDQYKEFGVPYNPYTETLIIEKAVVIKKDGSEVKADVSRNAMVFKQLEENDCVYIKWKTKNHYNGRLSNQFWDENYFNGGYPVVLARFSLLVPEQLVFNHRTQHMPDNPVKRTTEDGLLYEWSLGNEPAIVYEAGMPPLTDVAKVLYISSIQSWDYLVDWYTDLARTKTRSTFEIREQVEELFEGKKNLTEEEKIRIVYDFITENIRYSSVPFRQSPLVPQKARDVLVNRIGDCKDVATLCIAMLREVGITAHHVLVNTADQGSNANILPTIAFNHAIAAVETEQGIRYLDLTANNFPYGSAPSPDINAFSLLIAPNNTKPGYLGKKEFSPSNVHRKTTVTIAVDNSISVRHESKRTGVETASVRFFYRDRSPSDREKLYVQGLTSDFPNVRLTSLSFTGLDTVTDVVTVSSGFEVPDYVSESGRFRFLKLPWADKLGPNSALVHDTRMYPIVDYSHEDTLREQLTVKLPKGYVVEGLPPKAKLTSEAAEYSVSYKLSGGALLATREFIRKKNTVLPEEYAAYRKFYNDALKEDTRQIVLRKK